MLRVDESTLAKEREQFEQYQKLLYDTIFPKVQDVLQAAHGDILSIQLQENLEADRQAQEYLDKPFPGFHGHYSVQTQRMVQFAMRLNELEEYANWPNVVRDVVLLFSIARDWYIDNMLTIAEIVHKTGVNPWTLRTRIARARTRGELKGKIRKIGHTILIDRTTGLRLAKADIRPGQRLSIK